MPSQKNRLSQFWRELRRRNVTRVVTVYAATTFAIIDLLSNIEEPLGLPEWTLAFAIVILSIGFIIAVILSWIYDFHPLGGIVKTEPVKRTNKEDLTRFSNSWKIASYISFGVIVGLIVLNIISRTNDKKQIIEKSIAVLPFTNDSPNSENEYIINGYQASVHNMLCHIKDLRVLARSSTETYRNNPEPIREIARELNVAYLLTASGQIYNNKILLIVHLWDADEKNIWSHSYDMQITEVEDNIDIQSDIAQMVAGEIQAVITPEEKQLIEKIQTTNITSWDFYNKGNEELLRWQLGNGDYNSVNRAKTDFEDALKYDKDFARAYVGLGLIYRYQNYGTEFYQDNFLDSCLFLANKALSIDSQIEEAYSLRGFYYEARGDIKKALILNSNSWEAHWELAKLYHNDDILLALEHSFKTIQLYRGTNSKLYRGTKLAFILDYVSDTYLMVGLIEQGVHYMNEILKLENDSAEYFLSMAGIGTITSNYKMALDYAQKAYQFDSTNYAVTEKIASSYFFLKQYDNAIRYWLKPYGDRPSAQIPVNDENFRLMVANWEIGNQEEALILIKSFKNYCIKTIELGRMPASKYYSQYDLAGIYSFLGETDSAYINLRLFSQKERFPLWWVTLIKDDPLFDNIRDQPEFQQIVDDVEAKYQAEHDRVQQWLEENEML